MCCNGYIEVVYDIFCHSYCLVYCQVSNSGILYSRLYSPFHDCLLPTEVLSAGGWWLGFLTFFFFDHNVADDFHFVGKCLLFNISLVI